MFIFFQQRSCVSLPWTLMQNLKKNWSVVSKMTRSWSILTWALESLKNLHFFCYCAKYLMFALKKYRGIIFHDTGGWCKIWRKMDLWFGKWHEEYGKFWPGHLKVWKLGPWWDPFAQSIKCMSLKFTEELYSWQWGIDLSFQNWHKEFDKFWLEHLEIYKICSSNSSFYQSI